MRLIRQYPTLFFITTFILLGLACQAATNIQTDGQIIDRDAIVADAVATISAQSGGNGTITTVGTQQTVVDSNLQGMLIQLYETVNPSVVHIFIFDGQDTILGTGSGFVYDNDGHIVTNNHVVADGSGLEVVFADGQRRRAEITGLDVDSDLAVIQVDNPPANALPIPLGDSSALEVGQFVVTIGNPFGEAGSMSVGIISGLGRTLTSQRLLPGGGRFSIPQVIQTDAAINPGNSGGPLLNLSGQVVGVNSAIQTTTGSNSGVGFSIPVNAVRNIAPSLVENGRYIYPFMGIRMTSQPFTLDQLEYYGVPPNGVYVIEVDPNTPADNAGLHGSGSDSFNAPLPGGDYITSINGVQIKTSDELLSYLVFETNAGDTVDLTILRNGEEKVLPLTLGERP